MMLTAEGRGFSPEYVHSDTWYAGPGDLKQVRDFGWCRPTRLRGDRVVTPDDRVARPLDAVAASASGTAPHLQMPTPIGADRGWWA